MLLWRALTALQDPTTVWHRLEYPSLNIFITSDDEACVRLDPMLQGYIVLEIWDEQVNIGFGGSGHEFKDRAIRAIEQELEHRD